MTEKKAASSNPPSSGRYHTVRPTKVATRTTRASSLIAICKYYERRKEFVQDAVCLNRVGQVRRGACGSMYSTACGGMRDDVRSGFLCNYSLRKSTKASILAMLFLNNFRRLEYASRCSFKTTRFAIATFATPMTLPRGDFSENKDANRYLGYHYK